MAPVYWLSPPMLALFGIVAAVLPALSPAPGHALWPSEGDEGARGLAAPDPSVRLGAVLELAREDPARATPLLVPALRDRDGVVRLAAARLLARRGAREAEAAATTWLADPAPRERLSALLVLREAPELPDDARRAVERALRNGDITTRLLGLDLLAARPAPSSFGAVVALLDDELADVRLRALRALAAMADPRASLPVARRLADGDRTVRIEAAATLGALGDRRVVPALLRQLDDGMPDPRAPAVEALGRLGDPAALPGLARLAARTPRDDLARRATLALGAIGTPAAIEVLLALAREPPGADEVRVGLARAGAAAVPRLVRELDVGSPTSARLAAEALGRIGDRRATGALAAVVARGAGARVPALEALGRLADPVALPTLAQVALEGEVPELRAMALEALEATADERALAVVPRALADGDPTVRARAARLAGALGAAEAASGLVARLGDADPSVRREAAFALARLSALPAGLAGQLAEAARAWSDEATADALGEALERAAGAADRPVLARAYRAAASPAGRGALARGLAAADADAPLDDAAVVAALLRDAGGGGDAAAFAAEALGHVKLSRGDEAALSDVFARAETAVRARLAPALALFDPGRATLARELADGAEPASVRAAAAWALAGAADARDALREAARSPEPAVAANARAALAAGAAGGRRRGRWSAVTLVSSSGEPWGGRWVTLSAADGPPVWVLTDARGRARVGGLADGPLALRLPPEAPPSPATASPTR
jgi:HEAT repeat protein